MPLQFIPGDRDCSFLVGPYPVRERAVFDFERQFLARYRIRPKRRDASLHYCLVLIGSPRCAVVGCKFRKVSKRIDGSSYLSQCIFVVRTTGTEFSTNPPNTSVRRLEMILRSRDAQIKKIEMRAYGP